MHVCAHRHRYTRAVTATLQTPCRHAGPEGWGPQLTLQSQRRGSLCPPSPAQHPRLPDDARTPGQPPSQAGRRVPLLLAAGGRGLAQMSLHLSGAQCLHWCVWMGGGDAVCSPPHAPLRLPQPCGWYTGHEHQQRPQTHAGEGVCPWDLGHLQEGIPWTCVCVGPGHV